MELRECVHDLVGECASDLFLETLPRERLQLHFAFGACSLLFELIDFADQVAAFSLVLLPLALQVGGQLVDLRPVVVLPRGQQLLQVLSLAI